NTPTTPSNVRESTRIYAQLCAGCHGADAHGTDNAPGLAGNQGLRERSVQDLRDLIRKGVPRSGMPGFDLSPHELDALVALVRSLNAPSVLSADGAVRERTNATWASRSGMPGFDLSPHELDARVALGRCLNALWVLAAAGAFRERTNATCASRSGMPGFDLSPHELDALVALVRSLNAPSAESTVGGDPTAGESFFFGKGQCAS